MTTRLPPPVLGAGSLGSLPEPEHQVGPDPILDAYTDAPAPAAPTDAPGLPIGPDEVTAFFVAIGDQLARWRGDHWQIEPEETALVAPAAARQLSKPDTAMGAWLMQHGDAAMITLGLALIIAPRAAVEWQVMQYRRRQLELAQLDEEDLDRGPAEWSVGAPAVGAEQDVRAPGGPGPRGGAHRSENDAATLRAITGH